MKIRVTFLAAALSATLTTPALPQGVPVVGLTELRRALEDYELALRELESLRRQLDERKIEEAELNGQGVDLEADLEGAE